MYVSYISKNKETKTRIVPARDAIGVAPGSSTGMPGAYAAEVVDDAPAPATAPRPAPGRVGGTACSSWKVSTSSAIILRSVLLRAPAPAPALAPAPAPERPLLRF